MFTVITVDSLQAQLCPPLFLRPAQETHVQELISYHAHFVQLRYGLVVRIAGSHPAGPGSIPGNGSYLF